VKQAIYVLQFATGQTHRYVTRTEGERMVEQGQAVRLRAKRGAIRFRLVAVPDPSDSRETAACLTRHDMAAIVGLSSRGAFHASRRRLQAWTPTLRVAEATA